MFIGGDRTVDGATRLWRVGVFWVVCMLFVLAVGTFAAAMPAQVMIICHAEKFEDRHKTSLSALGKTRAAALAEFFRSDHTRIRISTSLRTKSAAKTEIDSAQHVWKMAF